MSYIYSGTTALDTPAVGTGPGGERYSWGDSVHLLYTYEPIPEPDTIVLAGIGLLAVARKRRRKASMVCRTK